MLQWILDIEGLVALGAPILCFDTCSVLDIMRDPTREKAARAHEQQAALDLVRAMESRGTLVGLVAEQVQTEVANNADAIENEAIRALKDLQKKLARIDKVVRALGGTGQTNLGHFDGHVTRARAVVDRLMAAATLVRTTDEIITRAARRAVEPRTPAQKGENSLPDCIIVETYIDVVKALRSAGLGSRIVFASSNTNDYAGKARPVVLKPDLAVEFAAIEMEYAPNLAAAKHRAGL